MERATNFREGRLQELDGWRAVSVVLVILHHVGWCQNYRLVSHSRILSHLSLYFGPLGVKVFFVISGFVICRLLLSEELRYGSISLKGFYYRRIFRILPPLFIYLGAVSLLLGLGLVLESRNAILGAALFVYDFDIPPHTWLVAHTWSLAVEEQFYLIFPATWILTPQRYRSKVFLGIFVFWVTSLLSMVYTGWHSLVFADTRAGFACISCGVLMAIHEKQVRRIAGSISPLFVMLVGITLLLHPVGAETWKAAVYEALFVPSAIGLVLLFSLDRGSRLRAFLRSRPVQAIGLTSYGIYLWQQLFTGPRYYYSSSGQIIPLLFPLLFLIVPLSYFLIEKPAMHYGKYLSRRAAPNSATTTVTA